jgi:uncharacterized membrane protein
VCGLGRP